MSDSRLTCVICKTRLCEPWYPGSKGFGHNPEPVAEKGRCCDFCNGTRVIPMRLKLQRERDRHQEQNKIA